MELKVWVEGIQRVVCGVCDRTTCQDVVYALAHATGKTGRFTLIERWRNNERLLAPHEHPLKVLMKWGEYSSDVHFILQRTALETTPVKRVSPNNIKNGSARPTKTSVDPLHGFTPPAMSSPVSPPPTNNSPAVQSPAKDLKKSLTFSGGRLAVQGDDSSHSPSGGMDRRPNVGVVRGIPKHNNGHIDPADQNTSPTSRQNGQQDLKPSSQYYETTSSPRVPAPPLQNESTEQQQQQQQHPSPNDGHLVYPRYEPPYGRVVRQLPFNGMAGPMDLASSPRESPGRVIQPPSSPYDQDPRLPPPYRNPPPPFAGTRQPPPPYREPPRPSSRGPLSPGYRASPVPMAPSPGRSSANVTSTTTTALRPSPIRLQPDETSPPAHHDVQDSRRSTSKRNLRLDPSGSGAGGNSSVGREPSPPSDPHQAQLIQKVNRQRETLDDQQLRLAQLEQELLSWEERLNRRLDEERQKLADDLAQLDDQCSLQEAQLDELAAVEGEWERACREGRQLADELDRWRADVSSIESRVDQCTPTLQALLRDVAAAEERTTAQLEAELAQVKADLEAANREGAALQEEMERVDEETVDSEGRLSSIRSEMDQLTQEIKQANLQSLSIAPADDLKVLLEGSHKTGHSRRMLGSPRQLENPVPTNRNPTGVWV